MKTTAISDDNHKRLRVKCGENELQIRQLVDKIITLWLESDDELGVIDSCLSDNRKVNFDDL